MNKLFIQLTANVQRTGDIPSDVTALLVHHGRAKTAEHCAQVAAEAEQLALRFGEAFGREPLFRNAEAPTALLSNGSRARGLFGPDPVELSVLIRWIAHWLKEDRPVWTKPTHFQEREGSF